MREQSLSTFKLLVYFQTRKNTGQTNDIYAYTLAFFKGISGFSFLHFASFVSFRLVTNLNPRNYETVSCVLHRLPYINARVKVVPVGNTWVRANCSAHDDLRPVKMYLMNVANEYFRSACANCQSDENRNFGKTGKSIWQKVVTSNSLLVCADQLEFLQ